MENTNIFEFATRNKVRFQFRGVITTEDLWDLNVTELDKIYKSLNSELKQEQEESLLKTKTKADELLTVKIEIIKHIVTIKQEEATKKLTAQENRIKKQKLLAILESKKEEEFQNKSLAEIQEMINELN